MRALPYPGHSWSFTQHAIGIEAKTLYGVLGCAALYEGETEDFSKKITSDMNDLGLLTKNTRDGVNDSWRDYQQILAELGLIYSTKISRSLRLTEAGHVLLAGEIGYSELMGIQALRYQYPNGQKSTIQNRLSVELAANDVVQPATLLELQVNSGLMLKPGTLILRLLVEFYESTGNAEISINECLAFVLPCKRNQDWPLAYSEIKVHRDNPEDIRNINSHARRNMQDWFSFLSKSELFFRNGNKLSLSYRALATLENIKIALTGEENPTSFWIATEFSATARLGWFDWFGHIGYSVQKIANHPLDKDFISKNFIGGIDDDDDSEIYAPNSNKDMNLTALDMESLLKERDFRPVLKVGEEMLNRINLGAFRKHSKTLLHNRIIASLAEKLQSSGATLADDRNSIDLLAQWPEQIETIFEIKTVTMRSLPGRLRMAIGQIEEYAYRRKSTTRSNPEKVIVINTQIPEDAWQVDFLNNALNIGLLCVNSKQNFFGYSPPDSKTSAYWK